MIDNRRNTTVRVELGVFWLLVLALPEVEIDGLVREAKLGERKRNFPDMTRFSHSDSKYLRGRPLPAVRSESVHVQRELLSVRHYADSDSDEG